MPPEAGVADFYSRWIYDDVMTYAFRERRKNRSIEVKSVSFSQRVAVLVLLAVLAAKQDPSIYRYSAVRALEILNCLLVI